ncbi:MAG: aldehyde dehydrogenase family protein [Betaproteobacteria bacterium]|nr:aldehyde dehydrogenase family protein [Betaproteobacteria bacterium]
MPTLRITNPANGKPVASLPADDAASVKAKFAAARAAQPAWARTPLKKRLAAIAKFRALVIAQTEELAAILTTEVGKPISQSRNELKGLIGRLDFFLEETARTLRPRKVAGAKGGAMQEVIGHEPLGVVANVSAWNYPYYVGANVFVPALATGNAVLYKPSEFATLTGLAIARMLHESGIPDDVFIPVIGTGEVGAALVKQPVDGVFFTGSYGTGKRIAQAVRGRMIRLQLELGGKDPVYVCEDVDVAAAAAGIADGAFYNTGQSCCSVERIYVHEAVFEAFLAAFVKEVKGFKSGDPQAEATYIGPLTRAPQLKVLEQQVADAKRKGAKILAGGRRVKAKGHWFEPTVMVNVDHSMSVMREESFGPIIGLMPVKDDAEAVRLMNDTDYGLTAGVYTRDRKRAQRVLAQVHAGSVYWNCCDRVSPRLPWSGVGHSGIGLTLSTHGIEAFTRTKAWHLKTP